MQDVRVQVPASLEEAQVLLAQQQQEIQRLHGAYETWMRAVSHDLRSPLRHVVSFAPLLKESVETLAAAAPHAAEAAEDAREFAGTMEHSARKMSAMLDGMAQVSRAARASLQIHTVDGAAAMHAVVQSMQARGLAVQWHPPHTPAHVAADGDWLQSALQVLLDNAVKFSARQPLPVIDVRLTSPEEGMWRYEVRDNGAGFDDARAQRLGELFQRMHRDNEFEGVGCGLALLDTIAQRHHARWRLQSQPQQGCLATLDWPSAASLPR